jgi:hypothetical protein
MVAIGIMSLIVVMAGGFFYTGIESLRYGQEFDEAVVSGRRAVADISREIRGANTSALGEYPIGLASDQELIFYSDTDYDGDYDKISYYLSDRKIYKSITDPGPLRDYTVASSTIEVTDFVNNGGQEIFQYYDSNGDETDDLDSIRMINIRLLFNVNPGVSPDDIPVETDAHLRNLKSNL